MVDMLLSCSESESRSVVSNSLWPHGLYSPWNSPGWNRWSSGVAYHFSSRSSWPKNTNRGLLHCRQILYELSYQERLSNYGVGPCFPILSQHGGREKWSHLYYVCCIPRLEGLPGNFRRPPPRSPHTSTPSLRGLRCTVLELHGGSLCWVHSRELQDLGKSVVTWLRTRLRLRCIYFIVRHALIKISFEKNTNIWKLKWRKC